MKKHLVVFLAATVIALTAFGCQKRVSTQPTSQPTTQMPTSQPTTQPDVTADRRIETVKEAVASQDVAPRYSEEKAGMFADVLFDFDKYDIADKYRPVLQSVAAYMTTNKAVKVSIEGHCDARGTNEYNLALGDRRAKAVSDHLVSLGVPSSRIETISYGEEKPVCTESTEECWQKNRRAHFVVLK